MRKHNKKAKRNILLELLKKTYINKSDVAFVANEVEDIQKQKNLNYKKSVGTITQEEEQLLDKLNKNEARLLATELLDNNGKIKELEIIPDLIAWNLGGGKYGSGLYNVHDQFFTRNMFPETNYYLEGLLYKIKNK